MPADACLILTAQAAQAINPSVGSKGQGDVVDVGAYCIYEGAPDGAGNQVGFAVGPDSQYEFAADQLRIAVADKGYTKVNVAGLGTHSVVVYSSGQAGVGAFATWHDGEHTFSLNVVAPGLDPVELTARVVEAARRIG